MIKILVYEPFRKGQQLMLQYKDRPQILLGLAMIKIDKVLEEKKKAKMLLQIHDELIFECLKKDES
jgi:hypothetical protein